METPPFYQPLAEIIINHHNMASHVETWKQLAVDYKVYDPVMVGSIDGTDSKPHDRAIYRARDTKCKSLYMIYY